MGQREETTEELSERVLARLRREYSLVSSEVWVDDVHRVDFVGFRPARNSPFPSSIERGEFVSIMGASGSGKSTLLNILGILTRPDVPGRCKLARLPA